MIPACSVGNPTNAKSTFWWCSWSLNCKVVMCIVFTGWVAATGKKPQPNRNRHRLQPDRGCGCPRLCMVAVAVAANLGHCATVKKLVATSCNWLFAPPLPPLCCCYLGMFFFVSLSFSGLTNCISSHLLVSVWPCHKHLIPAPIYQ